MTTPRTFRWMLFGLLLFLAGGGGLMSGLMAKLDASLIHGPRPGDTSVFSRTLTDSTGHVVKLPEVVHRVATPGISMAALILVLGGHHRLAAITPEVRDNPWLRRIAPEIIDLPAPFSRPAGVNLEALLVKRPELVTLWRGNTSLGQRLESANVPVLYLGYTTPEEMMQEVQTLGQALGPDARRKAEEFVQYYTANLRRVAAALAGLSAASRPRVYYASISPLHSEGSHSMITAWIEAAGGINVAAQGGLQGDGQVHLEDVLAWNPEIIITLDALQRKSILEDSRWQHVSAVHNKRVFANPRGINAWCTRAAEASLQVLWAARLFHPERMRKTDMGRETRQFYRQFYAYTLSDNELARVLQGEDPSASDETHPARRTP